MSWASTSSCTMCWQAAPGDPCGSIPKERPWRWRFCKCPSRHRKISLQCSEVILRARNDESIELWIYRFALGVVFQAQNDNSGERSYGRFSPLRTAATGVADHLEPDRQAQRPEPGTDRRLR